ncbi:D-allose-binding periplasmic protein precursor [Posidoniimonas polymericola]|uniref:D-allose-binding periplasmic protein n=1 Tax=Posidoniimonas polymericola TaxID=2528002 RepID=A0A5C5YSB7_9BACT|nr:substrate-binding domain-containing protein [Posidoniimonas polymericola]TWT77766.1 D-allose-binding periplasmic protein precursor [Posidoniimonas polymericola]
MSGSQRFFVFGLLALIAAGVVWFRSEVYSNPQPLVEHPELVLVTGGSSPYWQLLAKGAVAAADELDADLELKIPADDEDAKQQTELLVKVHASEVDGVAISPLEAEGQTRLINDIAGHALVITVDSDAPQSNRIGFVGASNHAAGIQCAELVEEALGGGGKVVVLAANMTKQNMLERVQGIKEKVDGDAESEGAKVEIVDVLIDEGDAQRCQDQLIAALEAHPDLAGVVGLNSYHGGLIAECLKQKELDGKLKVVAFDALDETLDAIESGVIFATVAQDPYQYGYEAVARLVANCQRSGIQLPLVGGKNTMNISTQKLYAKDLEEYRRQFEKRMGAAESTKAEQAPENKE